MTFMVLRRGGLTLGIAASLTALSTVSVARADSVPSGWTADDAPLDAAQPPPPAQPPAAAPRPASRRIAPQPEPQQQPDPSWFGPDDAAPAPNAPDLSDPINEAADADTDPSALDAFNQTLAGHGTWVDDAEYGRLWVPNADEVGDSFAPYQSAGHWTLDDQSEWLWTSDYAWGAVPFHYGRWLWVPQRGWGWIPGRTYAPAWVSWRVGAGGYVGWAPRAPGYFWRNGRAIGFGHRPVSAYCFAPTGRVFAHNLGSYVVRTPAQVRAAAAGTRAYHAAMPTRSGARSRMSPTADQAHVSASAAAQARSEGHIAASVHAHSTGISSSSRGAFGSSGHGAYGHGFGASGRGGYGSSGHGVYGHSFNGTGGRSHAGAAVSAHAPAQHPTSSSPSHSQSRGASSSGHGSGHHR